MDALIEKLQTKGFEGEVDVSAQTRQFYSHDASLFEILPDLVVFPKNESDLQKLVATASELKRTIPNLSLTARSGGTCMSGGAVNDSIIIDFTKHLNKITATSGSAAQVQPGAFYRDFEAATLKHGAIMPSFPASREIAAVGGMVANDAGGEKSLEFGKVENFVTRLRVVLADGQPYILKPLKRAELEAKMAEDSFEGRLYKHMYDFRAIHLLQPRPTHQAIVMFAA